MAFATVGVSLIGLTVIVAVTVEPPSPASLLLVEACAVKCPSAFESCDGVNFNPARPSANKTKLSAVTTVVPSLRNNVPPVMFVIFRCVTSLPSAALRLRTKPEVLCVSSSVVASVTDGVCASGTTEVCVSNVAGASSSCPTLSRATE